MSDRDSTSSTMSDGHVTDANSGDPGRPISTARTTAGNSIDPNPSPPQDNPHLTSIRNLRLAVLETKFEFMGRSTVPDPHLPALKDIEDFELSPEQSAVMLHFHSDSRGPIEVDGPAGSGKSQLVLQMIESTLRTSEKHQILIVSNADITSIAEKVNYLFLRLRAQDKIGNNHYVVSLDTPWWAEIDRDQIRGADTTAAEPDYTAATVQDQIDKFCTNNCDKMLAQQYLHENRKGGEISHEGLRKNRMAQLNNTLHGKVLEIIGYSQGPNTHPDLSVFADIRGMCEKLAVGIDVDKVQLYSKWQESVRFTIRNAAVVIATKLNDRFSNALELIKDTAHVIVSEEHTSPPWSNFAGARQVFSEAHSVVSLGDWELLPQAIMSSRSADIPQFPVRGSPTRVQLREQHRMNQYLCGMSNNCTYGGRVFMNKKALVKNTMVSQLVESTIHKWTHRKGCIHQIDSLPSTSNIVEIDGHGSGYNRLRVIKSIDIAGVLLELHPMIQIAFVTYEPAEKNCLQQAINSLKAVRPDLFLWFPDRLVVQMVNECYDKEYEIVIHSILGDGTGLRLVDNESLGNIAVTRAKNGYILFADMHDFGYLLADYDSTIQISILLGMVEFHI